MRGDSSDEIDPVGWLPAKMVAELGELLAGAEAGRAGRGCPDDALPRAGQLGPRVAGRSRRAERGGHAGLTASGDDRLRALLTSIGGRVDVALEGAISTRPVAPPRPGRGRVRRITGSGPPYRSFAMGHYEVGAGKHLVHCLRMAALADPRPPLHLPFHRNASPRERAPRLRVARILVGLRWFRRPRVGRTGHRPAPV